MADGVLREETGTMFKVASDVQSLSRLPRSPRNNDFLLLDRSRARVDLLRRLEHYAYTLSVNRYRSQHLPPRLRALCLLQIHRLLRPRSGH